jgi:hypothetical protein
MNMLALVRGVSIYFEDGVGMALLNTPLEL